MIEELPQEIVLLRQLCEANANTFCNEQMSTAIKFAEDTFNELIRLKEAMCSRLFPYAKFSQVNKTKQDGTVYHGLSITVNGDAGNQTVSEDEDE